MNTDVQSQSAPFQRPQRAIARGQLLIGGQWRDASDGRTEVSIDPSTEQPIADVAVATAEDAAAAVRAARQAFDEGPWPRMNPDERTRILFRAADLIEAATEDLAYHETIDMGMLLRDATQICVPFVAASLRYYAGWSTKIDGSVRIHNAQKIGLTIRNPIGVVAAISPFNFPLILSFYKIAPALACGCTIVHKPASSTPLSAIRIAQLLQEAGVPEGVFNLLTGAGSVIGNALVKSPLVNKVGVTGSTNTGRQIIKDAANTFKHVTTELGGKSPNIIFAEADLDRAVEIAFWAAFGNKGEQCFGGTRLLVEQSVYEEVVARLSARVKGAKVGDPFDPSVEIGPLATRSEYTKVRDYIRIGLEEDHARIAAQGDASQLNRGWYVPATLMTGVTNTARIAQEEIFGPVLPVIPFKDLNDAVQIANDTPYGLASAVHTRDQRKLFEVARRLQAGVVWANTYGEFDSAMPFGGVKASGIGRELGTEVLDNYLQTKSVWLGGLG
jgi:acyl-CoA reductase-like NAD-dependent aldehyde dehydrogenase